MPIELKLIVYKDKSFNLKQKWKTRWRYREQCNRVTGRELTSSKGNKHPGGRERERERTISSWLAAKKSLFMKTVDAGIKGSESFCGTSCGDHRHLFTGAE